MGIMKVLDIHRWEGRSISLVGRNKKEIIGFMKEKKNLQGLKLEQLVPFKIRKRMLLKERYPSHLPFPKRKFETWHGLLCGTSIFHPKVKLFLWQVCSHCLLTFDLMLLKQVNCSSCCHFCDNGSKSLLQIFVDCVPALNCWRLFGIMLDNSRNKSFKEWVFLNSCKFVIGERFMHFYHGVLEFMECP